MPGGLQADRCGGGLYDARPGRREVGASGTRRRTVSPKSTAPSAGHRQVWLPFEVEIWTVVNPE